MSTAFKHEEEPEQIVTPENQDHLYERIATPEDRERLLAFEATIVSWDKSNIDSMAPAPDIHRAWESMGYSTSVARFAGAVVADVVEQVIFPAPVESTPIFR